MDVGNNDTTSVGGETIVTRDELMGTVSDILIAYGASAEDAGIQAGTLVEAELKGHASHGLRRLAVLVARMQAGLAVSPADISLDWTTESVLQVDGGRGLGPVVAFRSVDAIVERAAASGIAVALVHNANHIGMMAAYVERIAAAGQVGIALTTSEALVHAWGGARALVGTNPIGIAVPTATEPLVLDMSTGAVSVGRILDHREKNLPLPLGWAVDREGRPTTDAAAAVEGAVSPFGGAKGYALGVALEAMVSLLTGSALGTAVRGTLDAVDPASKGDVFIAISLARLGLEGGLAPLTDYLEEVRRSTIGPEPVAVPGDRARADRAERLAKGLPLHPVTRALLQRLKDEAPHD